MTAAEAKFYKDGPDLEGMGWVHEGMVFVVISWTALLQPCKPTPKTSGGRSCVVRGLSKPKNDRSRSLNFSPSVQCSGKFRFWLCLLVYRGCASVCPRLYAPDCPLRWPAICKGGCWTVAAAVDQTWCDMQAWSLLCAWESWRSKIKLAFERRSANAFSFQRFSTL